MNDETSPEDEQSAPGGQRPPSSRQLDGLLGELDDHFGDRPPPPPPPPEIVVISNPSRGAPGDWIGFALAGAVACAIAQALCQQWSATIRFCPFGDYELGPSTWGAIEGFVIGLQGGWACWAWQGVRAERFNRFGGSLLILLTTGSTLIGFAYLSTYFFGAGFRAFEFMAYQYALATVGVLGSLYAHLGSKDLVGRVIGSYLLSQVFGLPITLLVANVFGLVAGLDFVWRTNFPAYVALPLAWALLRRWGRDPLPYQAKIA